MPFTLTFHSIEEKIPEHGTEIAFFNTTINGYGFQCMDLKYGKVFYSWDDDNGTSWLYDGEEEFVYDDGTKPSEEENINLMFNIEECGESLAYTYGPVSNIKPYFSKTIFWTDYDKMTEIVPEDGGITDESDFVWKQ